MRGVNGIGGILLAVAMPWVGPAWADGEAPKAQEVQQLKGRFVCGAEGIGEHKGHFTCVKCGIPALFVVEKDGSKTSYVVVAAREKAGEDLKRFSAGKALQKEGEVEVSCEVLEAKDGLPARLVVLGEEWVSKKGEGMERRKEDGEGGMKRLQPRIGKMGGAEIE